MDEVLDASKYRCIRCKCPADIIFKLLPYCTPHEPAESKTARTPKEEVEMSDAPKTIVEATEVVQPPTAPAETTVQTKKVGGGWLVRAKDGSELHGGFESKKDASQWASLEVEAKKLKAGQYKIEKL
jgi:hypothetical protein